MVVRARVDLDAFPQHLFRAHGTLEQLLHFSHFVLRWFFLTRTILFNGSFRCLFIVGLFALLTPQAREEKVFVDVQIVL